MEFNDTYVGTIVDTNDPIKIGRCRVMIDILFEGIDKQNLPWAYPSYPNVFGKGGQSGSISVPKEGSVVRVKFINGDIYQPIYECNQELAEDVKEELNNEYKGTHILLYDGDEGLKIYYTKGKGLSIELNDSLINIDKNSKITIDHKESKSTITLDGSTIKINSESQILTEANSLAKTISENVWMDGKTSTTLGPNPVYSAVKGEPLFFILAALAKSIDEKMYATPGINSGVVEAFRSLCLSDNVKVS